MPVYLLTNEIIFPDPNEAEPSGLLAIGGDLSLERLLLAYSTGVFPWYSEGEPILWFSPDPRLVFYFDNYKPSKSLMKVINSDKFDVKFDTNFEQVIKKCSKVRRKGQKGTWITRDMVDAYNYLHKKGYAHSVETYLKGKLVGGLYGVSLGSAFFGESMFHDETDASKVAFHFLVQKCGEWRFHFIDSQIPTEHMKKIGAIEISREQFLYDLRGALDNETKLGRWN